MLKRKWDRASIVLLASGLAMLLVNLLLGEVVRFVSEASIDWMTSWGVTLMLLGGFCHLFTSNRPHCGGLGPRPRWSYWDDEYCPRCGAAFAYDDRPGGPPKEKPEARPPFTPDRKPARQALLLPAAWRLSARKRRCPACQRGSVPPWPKPGGTRHCRSCGFEFQCCRLALERPGRAVSPPRSWAGKGPGAGGVPAGAVTGRRS